MVCNISEMKTVGKIMRLISSFSYRTLLTNFIAYNKRRIMPNYRENKQGNMVGAKEQCNLLSYKKK